MLQKNTPTTWQSKQSGRASSNNSQKPLSLLQQRNSQRFSTRLTSQSQLTALPITISSTVTNQPSQRQPPKTTLTFPFYRVRPSDAYAHGRGMLWLTAHGDPYPRGMGMMTHGEPLCLKERDTIPIPTGQGCHDWWPFTLMTAHKS